MVSNEQSSSSSIDELLVRAGADASLRRHLGGTVFPVRTGALAVRNGDGVIRRVSLLDRAGGIVRRKAGKLLGRPCDPPERRSEIGQVDKGEQQARHPEGVDVSEEREQA